MTMQVHYGECVMIDASLALELTRPAAAHACDVYSAMYPGEDVVVFDGERHRSMSNEGYALWSSHLLNDRARLRETDPGFKA